MATSRRFRRPKGLASQCIPSAMASRPSRRLPKPARRRVLELLATSPTCFTEALLSAHGIAVEQLVALVRAGLATASTVRITEAGRRALTETT
jgi:hypothetical protein